MKAKDITKSVTGGRAMRALALAGIVALVLLACENPFRAGLGDIVDMHPPTVTMVEPGPGAFIRGAQRLTGIARDDLEVVSVELQITGHPPVREGFEAYVLEGWQPVELNLSRSNDRTWGHTIRTYIFHDGAIRIRLRVTDGAGNVVVTGETVLSINNDPPAISMTLPHIVAGPNRGQLGSGNLNFGFNLTDIARNRGLDGHLGMLAGTVTHGEGVSLDYSPSLGRFPPQFRVWEVESQHDVLSDDFPIFPHGTIPDESQLPWAAIGQAGCLFNSELTSLNDPGSLQFLLDFSGAELGKNAHNRFFAVQLRAQSVRATAGGALETVLFPQGEWSEYIWNGLEPEQRAENSAVVFFLAGPRVSPDIEFLVLQDIRGEFLDGDYVDMANVPYDHGFLTDPHFNVTGGPFTMRVRAYHPEGIGEAMAFWEMGDRRGRFVWDQASGHPVPGNNVDPTLPFSRWGFASGNLPATRHFVFTNCEVGPGPGRGRIELFTGDNWEYLYRDIANLPDGWYGLRDDANWETLSIDQFGAGTFTVTVYARTDLGNVNIVPWTTTLAIDDDSPTIEITQIVGSFGELGGRYGATVVNGVIEARFFVSDDTGLRSSGGLFARPGTGIPSDELLFVLVCDSDSATVYSCVYDWPLNSSGELRGSISGVAEYWNVVRDGRARICTLDLQDETNYRIFVFARDRAFNVGRESFLLFVDRSTDVPRFDFSMGLVDANITDPDNDVARNMLRPDHHIRFSISDDDSLDLGIEGGAPSTLRISITRTRFGENDMIVLYGDPVYLSDEQVKRRFRPQTVGPAGLRLPVREREGTIPQEYFAGAIREAGDALPHLPDGIFRIAMRVSDCSDNKLTMPSDERGALPVTGEVFFYIVVDNLAPEIIIDGIVEGHLYGRFRDELGPLPWDHIALTVAPYGQPRHVLGATQLGLERNNNRNDVWEYSFRARIDNLPGMDTGVEVDVDFTMEVRNRFGNRATHTWQHRVDTEPPEVTLRRPISTFSRPSVITRHPGRNISDANAGRLANMVLDFDVNVTDNVGVAGIHWWLLPANESVTSFLEDPAGNRSLTWEYDVPVVGRAFGFDLESGRRGAFGRIAPPGGVAVIDTYGLDLPCGEYLLHIIAIDHSGNPSLDGIGIQTIYLLQYEDRPYFAEGAIRPDGGRADVRGNDMVVTGIVRDDDGFGAGMFPDANTVQVWISGYPHGLTGDDFAEPSREAMLGAGWDMAYVPSNLLRLENEGTSLILEIDLLALFRDFFDNAGDGMKHYVLRVLDSAANKVSPPSGSPDRVVGYSPVFSFMRDIQPPELVLTHPHTHGQTVGWSTPHDDTDTFFLRGFIQDANIGRVSRDPYGYPYLMLRFNDSPIVHFHLTDAYIADPGDRPSPSPQPPGMERVYFRIPATSLLYHFGDYLNDGDGDYGNNLLELRVVDMTGAPAELSRGFVIDRGAPYINVLFGGLPAGHVMDEGALSWWWNEPTANTDADTAPCPWQEWSEDRRVWAAAAGRTLPVIAPEAGGRLALSGYFSDAVSDIDVYTAYVRINNEAPARIGIPHERGRLVNWTIDLGRDDLDLADGVHTISLYVSDEAGNRRETGTLAFRIDREEPDVGLAPRAPVLGDSPGSFVSGWATDANLRDVRLELRGPGGSPMPVPGGASVDIVAMYEANYDIPAWDLITVNWEHEYDDDYGFLTRLVWSMDVGGVFHHDFSQGGNYEITVRALDFAGNLSASYSWAFTWDTLPPTIHFETGLATSASDDLGPNSPELRFYPAPGLPGAAFNHIVRDLIRIEIRDPDSEIDRVRTTMERWDWDAGAWATGTWHTVPSADLGGTPRHRILNMSMAGQDPGLFRVRVEARDSAWRTGNYFDSPTGNYDTSEWLYFYYRGNPSIVFDADTPLVMSSRYGAYLPGTSGIAGYLSFRVTASDANRIGSVTASVDVPGNPASLPLPVDWGNADWADEGRTVTLRVPVPPGTASGSHTVTVTAISLSGVRATAERPITLDNRSPGGAFSTPALDATIDYNERYSVTLLAGQSALISGITEAGDSSVERVYFRVGLLPDFPDHHFDANHLMYYYTGIASAALDTRRNDGVFDGADTWFLLAEGAPMPPHFDLRGHHTFNWQLYLSSAGLIALAANDDMTHDTGVLRLLPIWFRVVDNAGNAGYFHRIIRINPEGDRPELRIDTPEDGWAYSHRGGAIVFSGAATIPSPEVGVSSVLYRVFVGGQGYTRPLRALTAADMGIDPGDLPDYAVLQRDAYTHLHNVGSGRWFYAEAQGGGNNIPWHFTLNAGNEIASLIGAYGFPAGSPHTIRVWVEMVAINDAEDTYAKTSLGANSPSGGPSVAGTIASPRPHVREFYLRESAPQILNVRVDAGTPGTLPGNPGIDPVLNNPHRGLFTVSAILDASDGQTIHDVRIGRPDDDAANRPIVIAWRMDGTVPLLPGLTVTARTSLEDPAVPDDDDHDGRFFTLRYVIDSEDLIDRDPMWASTGGLYRVDIRIRDNSSPMMEATHVVPVYIDNFAPAIATSGAGNPFQAGTGGILQSTVFDFQANAPASFAAAGVDRVYAWFERGGFFYAMYHGGPPADPADPHTRLAITGNTLPRQAWSGRTVGASDVATVPGGSLVTVNVPSNAGYLREISLGTATPGTGLHWIESHGGREVQWQINLNTTRLPDGPITLRYIVVDAAGNASLHQQIIIIRNRFPEITGIVLHTSPSPGATAVANQAPNITDFDPETSSLLSLNQQQGDRALGFIDSGFIVRNQFLGLTVRTIQGNAPLNYRLQPVTRERLRLNDTVNGTTVLDRMVTDRMDGTGINLYTIASQGNVSMAEWIEMGVTGVTDPMLLPGTHFVFMPTSTDGLRADMDGEIWRYTQIGNISRTSRGPGATVLPNPAGFAPPGNDFNFSGAAASDNAGTTENPAWTWGVGTNTNAFNTVPAYFQVYPYYGQPWPTRIPQFLLDGSPYGQMNNPNDPRRPFFLLRVWDTVTNPGSASYGTGFDENDQLHTAVVIYMDIYTYDDTPPGAILHPLNPAFERAVAPTLAATIGNALDPLEVFYTDADRNPNRNRGGLFNTGTLREPARSGYIDPNFEVSTGVHRDVVSGEIILRGRATDNRRISTIELAIYDGTDVEYCDEEGYYIVTGIPDDRWFTILEYYRPDGAAAGTMRRYGDLGVGDVGVGQSWNWRYGHVVEWSYRWDTETFASGNPAGNVVVAVRTRDLYPEFFDYARPVRVDIVPYITGFERRSPYATLRSMQGWYSFYQGETGIRALGWNLGTGGTMNIQHGTGSGDNTSITGTPWTSNAITFTMPATARSGRINITVGSTPIHNHSSYLAHAWNRDNLFGTHSELWNNRPHAHVWRTNDTGVPAIFMGPYANSVGLDHPGMALEYTGGGVLGRLHGTWSVYGDDMVHYGRNDGYGITGLGTDSEATRLASRTATAAEATAANAETSPPGAPLVAGMRITSPGDPFVTPDISMFNGGGVPNIAFVHQWDGSESVMFRSALNAQVPLRSTPLASPTATHTASRAAPHAGQNVRAIDNFPFVIGYSAGPTPRWQNIRTATAATSTDSVTDPGVLYTAAFDRWRRSLVFVTRQGTTNTMAIIDGPTGFEISTGPSGAGLPTGNIPRVTSGVANSTNAGEFSAVGFDGTGPIVAYFDGQNNTVRIAFGTGTAPAASAWTRAHVLPTYHDLHFGSGSYISMAVDRGGGIHLAFFNTSHGALVYAHAPSRAGNFTAVVVDTMEGVGTWTDISVDHWGNPWIVYGYQGRQGNFDGVRMAYRSHNNASTGNGMGTNIQFIRPNTCRVTDGYITGWEAVSMAAPFRVAYDRLNIEAWPPNRRDIPGTGTASVQTMTDSQRPGGGGTQGRAWGAAIGYASGAGDNRFRIGYFFWPTFSAME